MLKALNQIVWGVPGLVAILGVGLYLTIRTQFAQIKLLPNAFKVFSQRLMQSKFDDGAVSPYQAFCTALGATVGTGNIVGVAGAISIGGPGAVFWMWISAILGMITKYAEVILAVHYQAIDVKGQRVAGPMYVIRKCMSKKWQMFAYLYAAFGVIASLGVGNCVQINALAGGVRTVVKSLGGTDSNIFVYVLGIGVAILVGVMLMGGAKQIVSFSELLVPIGSVVYIVLCLIALVVLRENILSVMKLILHSAFSPQAVTGGAIGTVLQTVRVGTSRGVFTNEAGLGTAGIAHGCIKAEHPAKQGVLGIMEVFIDTIVICTLTALVILCSGVPITYGTDMGSELTNAAFAVVFGGWSNAILSIIIIFLALATVMGWGLYGSRCAEFLFGTRCQKVYALFHAFVAFLGVSMKTPTIWLWAELVNGLMMIPNLIVLLRGSQVVITLTRDYMVRSGHCNVSI